jgi:tetratricopeptide (TPR) repeat protein
MRSLFNLSLLLLTSSISYGQGNCLLYPEGSGERIACELSYRAVEYRQGSRASQTLFDKAIELGPNYAWAYYEKSVPYFKRGLLSEGVSFLNKAIAIEPTGYLYYRAYWYFQNRSFVACIADLEKHYFQLNGPVIYTPPGDMDMRLLLSMAYAHSDSLVKGIETMEKCIASYGDQDYLIGAYDYHLLGVLYYRNQQYAEAIDAFNKQLMINENIADSYYYLGLTSKAQSKAVLAQEYFTQSLRKYDEGFSPNLFLDFNLDRSMIEIELLN